MIKKIKTLANTAEKKRLLSNFFSLSSIQLFSYILPLITIPYLVRVIGIEKFGLINFVQAVIQYFVLFTDYGFGMSATKQISIFRDNKFKINEIFNEVMFVKLFMVLISLFILTLLVFNIQKLYLNWQLYYLMFGIVIGQSFFPIWFFQGIERMGFIAFINIIPKILFTLSIFIFVKVPDDYILVPIFLSLGYIVSAIISLYLIFKKFNLKIRLPSFERVKFQIFEGWHIFLGTIGVNFMLNSVVIILGFLTNNIQVGYYTAVEKVVRPIASLTRPISNVLFPFFAKKIVDDKVYTYFSLQKISILTSLLFLLIAIFLNFYSKEVILLFFGSEFLLSENLLKIMSFIPFLHSILHIFIIPGMILFDLKKKYSLIIYNTLVISILLTLILIHLFGSLGAAISVTISDIILSIWMFIYLHIKVKKLL